MSKAKELVLNKLYELPDNLQDEMEVIESLYKLIKLEKSKMSAETDGTLSTDDAKEYFANKHKKEAVSV